MTGEGELRATSRRAYAALDRLFAEHGLGERALFLDWGYAQAVAEEADRADLAPPAGVAQAAQWRLVLEALAGLDLEACDVLDVGCGRGGALTVLARQFACGSLAGLDLSEANIAHCRRLPALAAARLQPGDACRLPYRDQSFDCVLNIESASGYADFKGFLRHAQRVLRVGGVLVYVDLVPADCLEELHALFAATGLAILSDRDVTANVLAARRQGEAAETALFAGADAISSELRELLRGYRAGPGSGLFGAMQAGTITYRILQLRREGEPLSSSISTPRLDQRQMQLQALSRNVAKPLEVERRCHDS